MFNKVTTNLFLLTTIGTQLFNQGVATNKATIGINSSVMGKK
jgi:hypothetical protein